MLTKRISHLDFVRGVAALAVCAGHLRAFQFVVMEQATHVSLPGKAFYFLTGYGHQAVMVFFVLSGYFIAGSVSDSVATGRWSWSGYAVRRLTRLWLVLIPALLLTLFWDCLGLGLTGGAGYNADFSGIIHSGPTPDAPFSVGWLTFLGNVFFLQTVASPVFGTNSPLWSLANEFWYYLLFPLAFMALHSRTPLAHRVPLVLSFSLAVWFLPAAILAGFVVWLLGYAVHVSMQYPTLRSIACGAGFFCVSFLGFIASLLAVRLGAGLGLGADLAVGFTFATMLPFLISRQPRVGWYVKIATALSEISYTLYVVHFPVLAFLFFSFRLPIKSPPGPGAYLFFAVLLMLVIAYAWAVWWLFERRTDIVRKSVESLVRRMLQTSRNKPDPAT